MAIIGPNGAGKSTLFNLISGRFAPTSGEILLNGRRIDGLVPYEISRLGLARSFQITNIFGRLSVFENLRCGLLWSMGYRYAFWKFLADLREANERAAELMTMIRLEKKRDVLAMNLTYAEQRALEIGITIAGGAPVVLLDEPTAGMSKSETTRFIELIREVTVGKTLLTVEHDMGVVFGLADKIAVLVYGEVIAFDTPDAVRANPRVQEAYLGSVLADQQAASATAGELTPMLRLTDLHAYYGKSHILHGVDLAVGRGRDRRAPRAQRLGALDHGQDHHGPGARRGLDPPARPGDPRPEGVRHRPPRHRLRAGEPRHLPQAHRPPEPAARRKAQPEDAALVVRRHVQAVPAAEGARAHRGRRAVRRRAADADAVPHADGRSGPDHDRRADRRPGAEDRRTGRPTTCAS